MKTYLARPVTVQAIQFHKISADDYPMLCRGACGDWDCGGRFQIHNNPGTEEVREGDWIVKVTPRKYMVLGPEQFWAAYEQTI